MNIGIDLDDTILSTVEQYRKYQKQYLKENNISEEELWKNRKYRVDYIKNNLDLIFSDVKLKDDAISVIKQLINNGNTIYIVTARSSDYCDDMYEFTKNNLTKFGIPYHKLILTEKYKLKSCLENNIDLMIDNSIDIYNELNGKINVLLFDEHNKYTNVENRVSNWKEISKILLEAE